MRLLFDENMPYVFARELIGHECISVERLNWRGAENGILLGYAEQAGFEALITLDDMRAEQNMEGRKISIVILRPVKQGKAALRALTGPVLITLGAIQAGEIRIVGQESTA